MQNRIFALLLFSIGCHAQNITVSGFIFDSLSNELVPSVKILNENDELIQTSNRFGFYSLSLERRNSVILKVYAEGFIINTFKFPAQADTTLNVYLVPLKFNLKEVEVVASANPDHSYDMSLPLSHGQVQSTPGFIGEKDIFKTLLLLPGVQKGVEGSNSFFVRGAGADQNLILIDKATVYNANHLFGFVSTFNVDALKQANFYKGFIPAEFGGRLGSVLDIQTRDGRRDSISVTGGVGLLTSRVVVEGPVDRRKKLSFLISGRRTFLDVLVRPFMSDNNRSLYSFYDLNTKTAFRPNPKNTFSISTFFTADKVHTSEQLTRDSSSMQSNTILGWRSGNASVRWDRVVNEKLFFSTSFSTNHYRFVLNDCFQKASFINESSFIDFSSDVAEYSLNADVDYFAGDRHTVRSGLQVSRYVFSPRSVQVVEDGTRTYNSSELQRLNSAAIYLQDRWTVSSNLILETGFRFAFIDGSGLSSINVEPRVLASYFCNSRWKLYSGYVRMNQPIHLLSNTGVGLSSELWVPSSEALKPQSGTQLFAGVEARFPSSVVASVDTYRRNLRNIIMYRPGSNFLNVENPELFDWRETVIVGKGESFGTELTVRKQAGVWSGSFAYTLGWVIHQFDLANGGKRFFPRNDSRHNFTAFMQIKLSCKVTASFSWIYLSGSPITVPNAYYYANFADGTSLGQRLQPGRTVTELRSEEILVAPYTGSLYSQRTDAYHRLDVSFQFFKRNSKVIRYWEVGVFNAYNRKNAYLYYLERSNDLVNQGQRIDLKKKSLFPILPSISYNFSF